MRRKGLFHLSFEMKIEWHFRYTDSKTSHGNTSYPFSKWLFKTKKDIVLNRVKKLLWKTDDETGFLTFSGVMEMEH